MGWTKNANAVISRSLSDFLRADYLLYGLMNEMALDNSHDIFLDGDHICRISNLARKIRQKRKRGFRGGAPRRGGARKTRPFGGSAGSGTLAGAGARGILPPSLKNLRTKISSTKKNRPLDNRIIGIKGNLCKKCTSSHESEYLSFFILSIVEHSQYENFASLLIHDVIKPVIFHRHYTNIGNTQSSS